MIIVAELFFTNRKRQEAGRSGCSTGKEEDPITRVYGTAAPSTIPESTDWWKKQQRDLFAMSDDAELGLMQTMVTGATHPLEFEPSIFFNFLANLCPSSRTKLYFK